jgi:uncharacterized protein (TIGR02246 family)
MNRVLLATLLAPSLALAAPEKPAAQAEDPMGGWVPPKVKQEAKDKQEIGALVRAMEAAGKKGDLDAAAALVDFPVMMITDDSKGQAMGDPWTREQWVEVMRPFYENPMKDMKITHKPTIFLLSDSLASVDDVSTMTMGKKSVTSRNSMLLVRRDGEWKVKAMAEGGWGDMMAESPQGAASSGPGSAPAGTGATGAGTTGTGTGATSTGTPPAETEAPATEPTQKP